MVLRFCLVTYGISASPLTVFCLGARFLSVWYAVGSESMVLQCGKVIEFVSEGGISVCGWFAAVADAIVGFTVGV